MGIVAKKFERVDITAELHTKTIGNTQEENFIRELENLIKDLKKFKGKGYNFEELEQTYAALSVEPSEGVHYSYTLIVRLGKSSTHA